MQKEAGDNTSSSQKYKSKFISYEIPLGINEVSDIYITLKKLVIAKISIDIITRKSEIKTSNVSRFNEFFFDTK